ncbi:Sodium/calcium exchanger protein-domain-containing protein [Spinellus fusiger]|nr:Sodium/calcium exchanger protein-domain-containing protein [Spinellus fusiger]
MPTRFNSALCLLILSVLAVSPLLTPFAPFRTKGFGIAQETCSNIGLQPNQCAYVVQYCDGLSKVFLQFYYCSVLWTPLCIMVLCATLLMLFGAVSVVASDFFCPNLQTISSKLGLSESMVFISAMDSGAGSLAIGELIGAAFFIVAIVSGCMAIIRPFQSKKITFQRDAAFLLGAVVLIAEIIYEEAIHWYHGTLLIFYYLFYVFVVLISTYRMTRKEDMEEMSTKDMSETSHLLRKGCRSIQIDLTDMTSSENELHQGHILRPMPASPSNRLSLRIDTTNIPRSPSSHGSISGRAHRHSMTPRVGMRTSLFSAIEFQSQVNHIKRATSVQQIPNNKRTRQISMPFEIPVPSLMISEPPEFGIERRQRASTVTDQLQVGKSPHDTTRRSSTTSPHSSTGLAEDYFTYLSAQTQQNTKHSPSEHGHFVIPEIRLAPPHTPQPPELSPLYHHDSTGGSMTSPQQAEARLSYESSGLAVPLDIKPSWSQWSTVEEVYQTLFPTLQNWQEKSVFSMASSLVAAPLVLVFTLTLPVAESEDVKVEGVAVLGDSPGPASYLEIPSGRVSDTAANDLPSSGRMENVDSEMKQGWCRWLLATQSIVSTIFLFSVMALNEVISFQFIWIGVVLGCSLAVLVMHSTTTYEPPSWFWMLSFAGFYVALHWIFLLANQVVGLLQAFGKIFDISDAIMGLTVFALGNSIGDFVANTAIAKMGFPTMAISACYAGPLLNMVLGVGVSSTYQAWKTHRPYPLTIAPAIVVSSAGLMVVLTSTLLVAVYNNYQINQYLGWWMIFVYCLCCCIGLLLEFS